MAEVLLLLQDPIFYLALWRGLLVTLQISAVTIIVSFFAGTLIGIARYSKVPVVSQLATVFIEFIRNIPLLLLIYFCFFAAQVQMVPAAIMGLTIFTSAIIAEVVRGGLNSIQKGQWEAALSQGFNYRQTMVHIILPQAVVKMIPPIVSQFVTVIKDSSFAMAIGAPELMNEAMILAASPLYTAASQTITIYIAIAAVYFVVNFALSLVARNLQKKLSAGRGTIGQ